jgi:hypothetical protein
VSWLVSLSGWLGDQYEGMLDMVYLGQEMAPSESPS